MGPVGFCSNSSRSLAAAAVADAALPAAALAEAALTEERKLLKESVWMLVLRMLRLLRPALCKTAPRMPPSGQHHDMD